jgi:N-acetylneuraminic acid mutarotase
MRKLLIILVILAAFQSCKKELALEATDTQLSHNNDVLTDGSWRRLADYQGAARFHTSGFSIGDKGYIGLGYFSEPLSGFMEYDPASNTWSQIADFGGGKRTDAAAFTINGKGYIFGGVNELGLYYELRDLWEYDPNVNQWTRKADMPGKRRRNPLAFSVGSYGYAGGGIISDTILVNGCPAIDSYISNDVYQYDPALNTWCKKSAFPGDARTGSVQFSIGTKGYLGTGGTFLFDVLKSDFWEYDPAKDKWTRKADVPGNPRSEATGFSISSLNRGYIGFGVGSGSENIFFEYNPDADKWTEKAKPNIVGSFRQAVGFSIGKKGYVGPGGDGDETQFWEFDPLH